MRRNCFEGKGRARRPINGRRGRYERGNGKERKPGHLLVGRQSGQGEINPRFAEEHGIVRTGTDGDTIGSYSTGGVMIVVSPIGAATIMTNRFWTGHRSSPKVAVVHTTPIVPRRVTHFGHGRR